MLDRIWMPDKRVITPSLVRGPGGGLLRAKPANTSLAKDTSCCCVTTARDCSYYGWPLFNDSQPMASHVTISVGEIKEPPGPCAGIGCADKMCCEQSGNKQYELPIRISTAPDWGNPITNGPWLWLETSAACYDEACIDGQYPSPPPPALPGNGGLAGELWSAECSNEDLGDGLVKAWQVDYRCNGTVYGEGSPPGPYGCYSQNISNTRWYAAVPAAMTQRNGTFQLIYDSFWNTQIGNTKVWACAMPQTITLIAPDN